MKTIQELRRKRMHKTGGFVVVAVMALSGSATAQGPDSADAKGRESASNDEVPAGAAAPPNASKVAIGVDAAFQLPLGKLADGTGVGVGGLMRGEYGLIPGLRATVRAGYVYSLKKDNSGFKTSVDDIPIWAGAKYFVTEFLYAGAELGVNMLKTSVEGTIGGKAVSGGSDRETDFGGDVGIGAVLGDVEARAQVQIMDFGHSSDSMAFMLNVGYNFVKL
jgi:hypothetical protein